MEENTQHDELGEGRLICDFFVGKPFITQDVLTEFCNKNGLEPITLDRYQELKYAYERDVRAEAIFPLVMAELSKLKPAREISGVKERDNLDAIKDAIEREIAHLSENLTYEELDRVLGDAASLINATLKHATMYVSNMAAGQIAKAAEKEFGSPIMVGALAKAERGGKEYVSGEKAV